VATFFAIALLFAGAGPLAAQELTPRAYWPAPTGTNVFVAGYQRSSGDVILDPSLPISGANSSIDIALTAYQRSLAVAGRSASLLLSLPYVSGKATGLVDGVPARRDISGVGDLNLRFAINIKGAPAMDRAGFAALVRDPHPVLGASVQLTAPTGVYETGRLINVGANRWALKADLGYIQPFAPTWMAEISAGGWFFGNNDDFLGQTRKQDAIFATEFHLIKTIRSRFWASIDLNYYRGGQTSVAGEDSASSLSNSRSGATLYLPFKGGHALKLSFSQGISTRVGQDFDTAQLSYYRVW
jgi:hypothetical protein